MDLLDGNIQPSISITPVISSNTNQEIILSINNNESIESIDENEDDIENEMEPLIPNNVIYTYKPTNCCEKYCCGSIPSMACGYPSGTVRAIIALFTLFIALGIQGFGVIWLLVHDNTSAGLGLATGLLGELGVITGFYYGSRSTAKKGDNGERVSRDIDRVV